MTIIFDIKEEKHLPLERPLCACQKREGIDDMPRQCSWLANLGTHNSLRFIDGRHLDQPATP